MSERVQWRPWANLGLVSLLAVLMLTGAGCGVQVDVGRGSTDERNNVAEEADAPQGASPAEVTATGESNAGRAPSDGARPHYDPGSSSSDPTQTPSPERTEAPTQYETQATSQYDLPADEPAVDSEVAEIVEQVDGTFVDEAAEGEVLAASAVDPQAASSQNEQAIADTEVYLTAVVADADRAWTDWFTRNGYSEPLVSYDVITPNEPGWSMDCGGVQVVHDTPNAYYCDVDALQQGFVGTIYLPATTMLKMWSGEVLGRQSKQAGDFAAAAVAAHEFGHHVQDEMSKQTDTSPPNGMYKELIADCFAGNWAAHAYYQGYLEAGDIEEAVAAMEAVGDDLGSHGTPKQRMNTFQLGYYGLDGSGGNPGDPATCIQYYWRQAA